MTNPDNIVRVRARNGGRASVYEANGWCQAYGSGILDGTGVVQNTSANMTVLVGGSSSKPAVLIAENPSGYKIALDLVGQQPVTITAPASNSRISAIVAYTDDLALESTEDTVTGSPASCGLIVVNGSSSASPSAPTDTQIRNAITADGATGSQASYAVIATITVASNATTITDSLITRNQAGVQSSKIDFKTFSHVVACGTHPFPAVSANNGQTYEVTIPEQPDTRYSVFGTFQTNSPGYAYLAIAVHSKTTTSFKLEVWNGYSANASGPTVDWVLIRND